MLIITNLLPFVKACVYFRLGALNPGLETYPKNLLASSYAPAARSAGWSFGAKQTKPCGLFPAPVGGLVLSLALMNFQKITR